MAPAEGPLHSCCLTTNFGNIHELIPELLVKLELLQSLSQLWHGSGRGRGADPPDNQCVFLLPLTQHWDFANSVTFYRNCR